MPGREALAHARVTRAADGRWSLWYRYASLSISISISPNADQPTNQPTNSSGQVAREAAACIGTGGTRSLRDSLPALGAFVARYCKPACALCSCLGFAHDTLLLRSRYARHSCRARWNSIETLTDRHGLQTWRPTPYEWTMWSRSPRTSTTPSSLEACSVAILSSIACSLHRSSSAIRRVSRLARRLYVECCWLAA